MSKQAASLAKFHGVVPYRYRPSDSMESNSVSVTVETCDKYSEAPALRAHSSSFDSDESSVLTLGSPLQGPTLAAWLQ